ncbi:MAG: beta-lactamase family protein [Desulfomonile tiedjei]|uniref:Beta-lactamase family protein n=1 Tax=Desulfomonile tiedjei TaxID=2358 RepID=A0A9D6YYS9_9BACT|nr:beta-lactamase family protein [Desulfomonile tiedjei]
MDFHKLDNLVLSALEQCMFTGAAILVSRRLETLFEGYYGSVGGTGTACVTKETLFDLASLTKVLATTPCWIVMAASDPKIVDLEISHWFADVPRDKAGITPRHMLAHCSGLPAWRPYYLHGRHNQDEMNARILSEPLEYDTGRGCIYSDLGFMLLASIVEQETGQSVASFSPSKVYEPLGLNRDLLFLPSGADHTIALTREGDPPGIVNDLNGRSLGGVSGHAGLFGTARGVAVTAQQFLLSLSGSQGFFDQKTIRSFCNRAGFVPSCTRALGFDTPSEEGSSSGERFSQDSIGHTGFTGVSLWIDIPREIVVVLLTNRVFMGESDFRIKTFRPILHNAVMELLE